jgi:hypothetical protein
MKWGWLFRWGSLWIGGHWSPHNRRLYLNFIPCVTLWITARDGVTPQDERRYPVNGLLSIPSHESKWAD